jgi:carboxyl-terminal processing protease
MRGAGLSVTIPTMKSNRSRFIFVIGSVAALVSIRAVSSPNTSGRDPASRALSIFSDVFSLTRSNYVEQTDQKTLLAGAYDGMSDALDPFSYYVSAGDRAAYKAQQASGAVDPGLVVARRGGYPYVVAPLPGSPAEKAGVRQGDLLDTIDGKPVRNWPLWKVRGALEGPEGTRVSLAIVRAGEDKHVTLKVPRTRYEPPALSTRWEKDVAIVRVPAFTRGTAEHLKQAIEEANKKSIKQMVIDVRGAIGGEIADAAPAASLFTGKGLIAKAVSRKLQLPPLEASGERLWTGRTVVLTDDSTAGPAEVFAAALHDRADATTVGEPTVGMAILQRLVPTEAGGSLFMTVARYVSPSGTMLGGKGLQPDERVLSFPGTDPEAEGRDGRDAILERGLELVRNPRAPRRVACRSMAGDRRAVVVV